MTENIQNVFTQEDADFINEELIKATSDEAAGEIDLDWQQLQIAAKKFLLAYQKLDKAENLVKTKAISAIMQDTLNNTSIPAALHFSNDKSKVFFTRAKYTLAFAFDEKVAKFRGQVAKSAVYVHYDSKKKQLSSFELPLVRMAQMINEDARLMQITPGKLRNEGAIQLEKDKDAFPNQQHLTEAQSAYMGTKARLMQFYFRSNAGWNQRKNGILMWKESSKWTLANVNSFGDMKEAYVAALMTKHTAKMDAMYKHAIGAPAYYDHELIKIFFENYISKVTNMAAIVEEDVVTKEGQYAVKSTGAGMPSMGQYLWTAQWISQQKKEFSKKKLENAIRKEYPMNAERNKIISEGNTDINRVLNELLQENKLSENQAMALRIIYDK